LGKNDKANWQQGGGFRQRGILEHPNIKKLQEKYGWDYKEKGFPREMPGSDSGNGFSQADEGKKSPMYGLKSFDDPGGTLVHTYYAESLGDLWKDMHRIDPRPCPFIPASPGRDWRGLEPEWSVCGDGFRIVQKWMLSAAGGHSKEIYDPLRKGGA